MEPRPAYRRPAASPSPSLFASGRRRFNDGWKKRPGRFAPRKEGAMDFRQLGGSGFKVPVLSLGTGTFGGGNEFFRAFGASGVAEATRLIDVCLDDGLC